MFRFDYKRMYLVCVVVPVVFIISGMIAFLTGTFRQINDDAAVLVSRYASEYLGAKVVVEKLSFQWPDRFYVTNAALYDPEDGSAILKAPLASVNLSPAALVTGNYGSSVQSITVKRADLRFVRYKDGKTNLDFIINRPKDKKTGYQFRSVIFLKDSRLKITDLVTGIDEKLTGLDSRINLKKTDTVTCNIKTDTAFSRDLFLVFGLNTKTGGYTADVNFPRLELSRVSPKYTRLDKAPSGTISGYAGIAGNLHEISRPEKLSCSLKLSDVSLQIADYDLKDISGYIQCRNTLSVFGIKGNLGGIPFASEGSGISSHKNLFKPDINWSFHVESADLKQAEAALAAVRPGIALPKADGKIRLILTAKGPIDHPDLSVKTRVRDANIAGYGVKDSIITAFLSGKKLSTEIKIKLSDSSMWLCGSVNGFDFGKTDPDKLTLNLRGNVICDDIGRYLPDNGFDIRGKIMSEYSITGRLSRPVIAANLSAARSGFRVKDQKISDIKISTAVSYDKQRGVCFDGLIIKNFLDANIMLSAEIKGPSYITGKAYVSELQLARLMKFFGKEDTDLSGNLAFVGSYKIRDRVPYLSGNCELYEFRYNTYAIDYLNCSFSASPELVSVNKMAVLSVPAKIEFSGIIQDPVSARPAFKGDFSIRNTDAFTVCRIFDYTMTTPMEGIVNGDLSLNGMLDMTGKQFRFTDLSGAGRLDFNDLMIDKYPFDYLHVDALISDNIVFFNDIDGRASVFNAIDDNKFTRITGTGFIDLKNYAVNGDLFVSDVNISDFRGYYSDYINASGICDIRISLDGYMNKLNVDAKGDFRRVTFNGKEYTDVDLAASLRNSELLDMDFHMTKSSEHLRFYAKGYDLRTRSIGEAGLSAENISAIELLELYSMSPLGVKEESRKVLSYLPSLTGGDINAELNISGSLDRLSGKGFLKGKDITCGSEHMQELLLDIDIHDGDVDMPEFTMVFPDIYITADAFPLYGKDKKTKTNLSVINLPVSRISNYTSVKDLEGYLTVDALFEGDVRSPVITASLDIQHPSYKGVTTDRISAGKITFADDRIDLSKGLRILIGDYSATLYGSIPWDPDNMRLNKEGPLDITFAMDRQNLAFSETLMGGTGSHSADGIFDSRLNISGTLSKPEIEGYLNIEDGTFSPKGSLVFNDINGRITVSNNHGKEPLLVAFEDFSFADNKNKPKAFRITDDSYIKIASAENSEMNISCIFDDYYLDAGDITDYGERIKGVINGSVSCTGDIKTPLISDNGQPLTIDKLYCQLSSLSGKSEDPVEMEETIENAAIKNDILPGPSFVPRSKSGFDPRFDIHLTAAGCDIRPPMTKLTCDARAQVAGSLSDPDITADGTVTGGRVLLHVARLRINKGSNIRFTYTDHTPDAILDASAFTDVRTTDRLGINNSYRVTVNVTGSVYKMNMEIKSDPEGLSETEILSAIGKFGISKSGLTGNTYEFNAVNMAASFGISAIMSPIEDFFVDRLGLDVFSFDYMEDEYAIVNVEKNFGRRYFISFYHNFLNNKSSNSHTGISKWELKVGARLLNRYKLSLGTDDSKDLKAEISFGMSF